MKVKDGWSLSKNGPLLNDVVLKGFLFKTVLLRGVPFSVVLATGYYTDISQYKRYHSQHRLHV